MTKLTPREKRLLGACIAVLFISGSTLLAKEFMDRRSALEKNIAALEAEKRDNDSWLTQREFQEGRNQWIEDNLPSTDSLGRAQGQLLEEFQNQALNNEIRVVSSSLPAAHSTAHYREVAVTLKLYGDQARLLAWLSTIQSPERFYIIKAIELDPDSRTRAATPQIECDITIARWFKPETSSPSATNS